MGIELPTIETLAPDQASLKAASKLTSKAKWPRLDVSAQHGLIWGECQGSGANPYRVIADTEDHGCKCTCPSRKFPCKHALALMWIFATEAESFTRGDPPEWVTEWTSRRRPGSRTAADPGKAQGTVQAKSIDAARDSADDARCEAAPDPATEARRAAAAHRRAEETRVALGDAMRELDQWIADQLRLGLADFLSHIHDRCRRIAARMVDLKATALAGRIDEMPARLLQSSAESRIEAAMSELGKLVLLTKAWRAAPDNADLRRAVATSETREQVLNDPAALRVSGTWEVLGERITTRRDGLVSHATWLLKIGEPPARFALLLDFTPASAGRRAAVFVPGTRFAAELAYYPAPRPLRALIADRSMDAADERPWPLSEKTGDDPLDAVRLWQDAMPWALEVPMLLGPGRIASDDRGGTWWVPEAGGRHRALPVGNRMPPAAGGADLAASAAIWNGAELDLLAARTPMGRLDF